MNGLRKSLGDLWTRMRNEAQVTTKPGGVATRLLISRLY